MAKIDTSDTDITSTSLTTGSVGNFDKIKSNLGSMAFSAADLSRIKFPGAGKLFFEIDGPAGSLNSPELDCIILYHDPRRAFWANEFSGEGTPPTCASRDMVKGVGDPGIECRNCPNNQWGSGKNNSKLCRELVLLFILLDGRKLPILLQLPPTSIQAFRSYAIQLGEFELDYYGVRSRIALIGQKNKNGISYSRVTLKSLGPIEASQLKNIQKFREQIILLADNTEVYEDRSSEVPF